MRLVRFNILKNLSQLRKLPFLSSSKITKNSIKIVLKMLFMLLFIAMTTHFSNDFLLIFKLTRCDAVIRLIHNFIEFLMQSLVSI